MSQAHLTYIAILLSYCVGLEEELLLNLKRKKLIVSKVQVHLSSTIGKGNVIVMSY